MAAKKKKTAEALVGSTDPRAPLDGAAFLAAAQRTMHALAEDLLARVDGSPSVREGLTARWEAEKAAKRTGDGFDVWRRRFVVQVAAAWILGLVFARTLEDRGLLDRNRIAGEGAADSLRQFLELAPYLTERDYLLTVFRELTSLPAAKDLFDAKHNPVWKVAPSAEGAKMLLDLFRQPNAEAPAFRFGQSDTRFLGDLYQDLDAETRERFALLQTPRFVESFILDQTLEPAITTFGLDATTILDPTCGSGHFLLGAFDRLVEHRRRASPGIDVREAAKKALDAVHGADLNPYAVAIAKFRLTLAFLETGGYTRLEDAPELPMHVVVGDSLLHGRGSTGQEDFAHRAETNAAAWSGDIFALEDEAEAKAVLRKAYAAVVGNPPYITVKDAVLREEYRNLYESAAGKYSLGAPFTERFFDLAREAGFVGMITANSFMKREFGKKLIEQCLPKVDLQLVVNTSGAYIPGHGTPTVLLFGQNRAPRGADVGAVLAKRGEPSTPEEPAKGLVWRSIAEHFEEAGFDNDFISVARVPRTTFSKHPWSLGGGGAAELKELLEERAAKRLSDFVTSIGFMAITGEDEAFARPRGAWSRSGVEQRFVQQFGIGEEIRDWGHEARLSVFFPYADASLRPPAEYPVAARVLWPLRRTLLGRPDFGGKKYIDVGRTWFELHQVPLDRLRVPLSIAFAFVATHNHFVLDRGGKVFNRSAPIIKLPEGATEDDHLALLAYLNSSTACFWMKQVFFDKGNRGEGGGTTAEAWEKFFEFDGTKLASLPIPQLGPSERETLVARARRLDELARSRTLLLDWASLFDQASSAAALASTISERRRAIAQIEAEIRTCQESLDWWWYAHFGWAEAELSPVVEPGGPRASDVRFAHSVLSGDTGRRYFQLCRLPSPEDYTSVALEPVVEKRLRAIRESATLGLLEQPVYKRTFREGFREESALDALRPWLRSQLEASFALETLTLSALTVAMSSRQAVVAAVDAIRPADGLRNVVAKTLAEGSVAFTAALYLTEAGMEKAAAWAACWEEQRREDVGGPPPNEVPPRYGQGDFRDVMAWRLRGRLNVPKEAFISYPGCESDEDKEPVYGWAGWSHLQQAQALATLYQKRKTEEGWGAERLVPMLAGLLELVPWVKQWHNEPNADFGGLRLGDYFGDFVAGECQTLGVTLDDLRAWRPAATSRARKPAAPKAAKAEKPAKAPRARRTKSGPPTDADSEP